MFNGWIKRSQHPSSSRVTRSAMRRVHLRTLGRLVRVKKNHWNQAGIFELSNKNWDIIGYTGDKTQFKWLICDPIWWGYTGGIFGHHRYDRFIPILTACWSCEVCQTFRMGYMFKPTLIISKKHKQATVKIKVYGYDMLQSNPCRISSMSLFKEYVSATRCFVIQHGWFL